MQELPLTDVTEHVSCVRRVPIFAHLTPQEQDLVGHHARPVALRDGDTLVRAGDRVGRLFVVHTGSVKLQRTSAAGRTQLIRVAGPGDVVGEHAFLTGTAPEYSAEAAADTRLCTFDHADLSRLVGDHPGIATGIMRSLSERLVDAERRLALSGVDVPARVAAYLLDLPATFDAGVPAVRLPWPKKDVASWLATTPESLSRALARLHKQGLIDVDGDLVRITDAAALGDLADR